MKKDDKLLSVLSKIINVIYIGLVVITILLVVWIAISPFITKTNLNTETSDPFRIKTSLYITASVPVAIGSGEEPRFDVDLSSPGKDVIQSAFVDEAQGILRLETNNWYLNFVSNLAKLITAAGLAYVFYLLRSILRAMGQGEVFSEENSQRLRRLGTAVLVLAFVRPLVEYLAAFEVLQQLSNLQPALSLPSPFRVEALFASLLILIIAQVWAYGLELKTDQELTI